MPGIESRVTGFTFSLTSKHSDEGPVSEPIVHANSLTVGVTVKCVLERRDWFGESVAHKHRESSDFRQVTTLTEHVGGVRK